MNELTYIDIFVGDNGVVVLVSSMLLALVGNLLKKRQRFLRIKNKREFSLWYWIKDNWDDMLIGFIVTYLLVRLLNVVTPYALSLSGLDLSESNISVSDLLVIVSILIGYYTDNLIDKLMPETKD